MLKLSSLFFEHRIRHFNFFGFSGVFLLFVSFSVTLKRIECNLFAGCSTNNKKDNSLFLFTSLSQVK